MNSVGGVPPSQGSPSYHFTLGGKNHLGSALQKHIRDYRELIEKYPTEIEELEHFLKKKLSPFLNENREAILSQCIGNGWQAEGDFNHEAELSSSLENIKEFLLKPREGEGPLFKLNEAIYQVHFFLVNRKTNHHS